MKHPYFRKRVDEQLKQFISSNKLLFEGINATTPHADDTFGIEGISYTKEYGSINAVSSIPDYWVDDFAKQYMKQQKFLIEKKHVSIQRIFIFEKSEYKKQEKYMRKQTECGIKVFYIIKNSGYFDPQWLEDDFLIQDEELLVQIEGKSHKFDKTSAGVIERITMDKNEVQQKMNRFERLRERAIPYKL